MTGTQLNQRYELGVQLDETPIFKVWVAKDRSTGRDVSIRTLNAPYAQEPAFHDTLGLAIREIEAVKHPGLERIQRLERDGETVYLVGDPVRGMALAERVRKLAPFSVPVAIGTAITICEAVAALHRGGLTHGDLGTHNIRVLPEGSAIVQLPGLWRSYSASRTAGAVVLPQMAPYLAPEISQGQMPSPTSDVYAIGVLLYQLLTGRHPYEGDSPVATAMKHTSAPTPSLREVNPNVPVAVDEVMRKALAKDPAQRYATAVDLLSDLRMIQDALRFGRNLTWPLRPQEVAVGATAAELPTVTAPPQPSPMPTKPKSKSRESYDGDVPNWLKGVLVFFLSLAAFMVGTWIWFNFQKPKVTTVPDIRRKTLAQAEGALKDAKLKFRVAKRIPSESYPQDTVIGSDPVPGAKVYEGDTISLEVSAGSRFVEIPDVRGMTRDEARQMLESIGLSLSDEIEEERNPDVKKGLIIEQNPEPRRRVERKTSIRVVVSSGSERVRRNSTSNRRYLYTITIELTDIDEQVLMRVDMTDARGTRTISEQERQPGELVELSAEGTGEEAIFLIYYDGELVTQVTKTAEPDGGGE